MIISRKQILGYLLFLVSLILLLWLGSWQLHRGFEKKAIAATSNINEVIDITNTALSKELSALNYRAVKVTGQWVSSQQFLLENRFYRSQPGYEVLTPFQPKGSEAYILVNRGWRSLSDIDQLPPDGTVEIKGQIYQPQKGFTLGDSIIATDIWPIRFLYYDFDALSQAMNKPLTPAVIVIDSEHPGGLTRIWQPGNVPPARHFAYAVQWWGLALTLIIFGLIWRKKTLH